MQQTNSFIYFYEDKGRNLIRIGVTKAPSTRAKIHEEYGCELLCVMPGRWADEQAIHATLQKYKAHDIKGISNKHESWYEATDYIYDWIAKLKGNHFAADTWEDATQMPHLEFGIWRHEKLKNPIDRNGQHSLLEVYSPRERAVYVSRFVEHSSASDEWNTPPSVIQLAREAMGTIDTDPASNPVANKYIKAHTWYGRELNGLDPSRPWIGNLWLNPPYGRGEQSAGKFIERLIKELHGNVRQAITCLSLGSMSARWFQPIHEHASLHLIFHGRINFIPPEHKKENGNGNSPSKGTVLSYFGNNKESFKKVFEHQGVILKVIK